MAWASKKQYAILMSSEEGKDLAEKLGEMEQDEFNKKFSELLGKSGQSTSEAKENSNEDNEEEAKKKWLEENDYESEDEVPWWERDDNADEDENEEKMMNSAKEILSREINKFYYNTEKPISPKKLQERIMDKLINELNFDNDVVSRNEENIKNLVSKSYGPDWDYDDDEEDEANEVLEYFKKAGVDIIDKMPEGWKETKGATTAPLGYKWVDNNKSRFSGERKRALLKLNK